MQPVRHLYIHFPFCAAKCNYCAFYSEKTNEAKVERFLTALEKELSSVADRLAPSTIFFGGGTPSLLTLRQFERVLAMLRRLVPSLNSQVAKNDFEWTVEVNPATVSLEKAKLLRANGVNRISMGVQSLDDALLDKLGRIHSVPMVLKSLEVLRQAGFENIGLDFIFGIPGQTATQWESTLKSAIALHPQHISSYELTYEDDTPMLRDLEQGRLKRVDETACLAMYQQMIDILAENSFRQYEISNFSLKGKECRHNLSYWCGNSYLGLGPSACGYVDGRRYTNVSNTVLYCERIEAGKSPIGFEETLPPQARAGELVAVALRMNEGISAADFEQKTGFRLTELWGDELKRLAEEQLVEWDEVRLRLTARGRFVADSVAETFVFLDIADTTSK